MNYDEIKKLWEEMMDADLTKMPFSTSASVPLHHMDKDKINQNYWGPSPMQQVVNGYSVSYQGISPTDKDAVGMYPYQEPERDEQGTFYGYKILHKNLNSIGNCGCAECTSLVSPRYPVRWIDGRLKADREPSEDTMFGIHCTKIMNHPELRQYIGRSHGYSHVFDDYRSWVLVRCALGGTVVETEQGFRAEYAQIVGVYQDGYWTSYKDYSERANARYYPNEEFTWREAEEWRYRRGHWKTNSGIDTGSLP